MASAPPKLTLLERMRPGWEALTIYWKAILAIQIAAILLVAGFFTVPSVREACAWIMHVKESGGILFSIFSGMMAAGVVPELIKWKLRPRNLPRPGWDEILHQIGLWGCLGAMVDVLYRVQDRLFGGSGGWEQVLMKTGVDLLIFTPFIALPFIALWFLWRECGYHPGKALRRLSWNLYLERVLPLLLVNQVYWIPILCCLYSLPLLLQFPFYLLASCAWSLLLIFMARRQIDHAGASDW